MNKIINGVASEFEFPTYIHKDSTTFVQDEIVKNELNQIELQYNAFKDQKFNTLVKENKELKLELSGYRQAILNNKEMLGLKEQNQELKKQQKKFIKYLEDEIENSTFLKPSLKMILQKYREIVNGDDDSV